MKTILKFAVLLGFIAGCLSVYAQKDENKVEKIDQEFILDDFSQIVINGNFNVYLLQNLNDQSSITINAEKGLFDNISYRVKNGVLDIFCVDISQDHFLADIYVSFKYLEKIKTFGSPNIETITNIEISTIDISLSEKSKLRLYVDSPELNCTVRGGGFMKLAGEITDLNIVASGNPNIDLEVITKSMTCCVSDYVGLTLLNASQITHSQIIDDRICRGGENVSKETFYRNCDVCFYVSKK